MSYKHEKDVYGGRTSDILLVIEVAAEKCASEDLKEVSVTGYIGEHQLEVKVKR